MTGVDGREMVVTDPPTNGRTAVEVHTVNTSQGEPRKVRIIPEADVPRQVAAPAYRVHRSRYIVSGTPVTATQSWQRLSAGVI